MSKEKNEISINVYEIKHKHQNRGSSTFIQCDVLLNNFQKAK